MYVETAVTGSLCQRSWLLNGRRVLGPLLLLLTLTYSPFSLPAGEKLSSPILLEKDSPPLNRVHWGHILTATFSLSPFLDYLPHFIITSPICFYFGRFVGAGRFWGHNRSILECFQFQPVTFTIFQFSMLILYIYVCMYIHSIDSFKVIGKFPKLLNSDWLFPKLHQFVCNYTKSY